MAALQSQEKPILHVIRCERGYIVPRDSAVPQRLVTGSTLEDAGFDKRVTARGIRKDSLHGAGADSQALANAEIVELWCGLRPDTPDHLPLLGPAGIDGLTIATGHYRNGILLTPITAKLVREWINREARLDGLGDLRPAAIFQSAGSAANAEDSRSGNPVSGKGPGSEFAHK